MALGKNAIERMRRERGSTTFANMIFAVLMIALIAFFIFGNFGTPPEHRNVNVSSDQPVSTPSNPAPVTR